MTEFTETQNTIMEKLVKMGISKEDIFSVMLVLTNDEKAKEFLGLLNENMTPDEIFEAAGKIAFGENEAFSEQDEKNS